jgi:mannose-6-phosphate isomerase-like protein (cupin superfamily)
MAYKSSPRPTFDGPAPIPYAGVTRHLWGDDAAGRVDDWIYISSMQIHQLVFGLPPGGAFRHSPDYRTVFAADEVLTVLMGTMVIANPETGEVQVVRTGESVFFRRDTWHHAFAWGGQELRVLEYFAPPPATGTSGKYAATKPYVDRPKYERPALTGHWPAARATTNGHFTVIREADLLWALDPGDPRVLTGIAASTEHLTAGVHRLSPGAQGAVRQHRGSVGMYVTKGRLNILLPEADTLPVWFELHPQDGFYLPEDTPYRLFNMGGEEAEVLWGCAPDWSPPG